MTPDSSTTPDDPLVGRTVCGCELLELIGQGGMGNLYKSRQLSLDRIVAVKVLSPALSSNLEFLSRFRREARALANLLHPNIVAVHDFGEEGDIHAIVMECVDGESVADILECSNIMAVDTSVDIVRQVADGLACAHRQGIIHCDLKPENILVTADGVAKVIDFGLAKSLRGDAMRITQDGAILGTPNYMSPEQCDGLELDARTDIYSLGATLYRMVVGVDAFDGENAFAIMLKHKNEPPTDPRQLNPSVPEAVAQVMLRMLEKPRERRFQSAGELLAALSDEGPAAAPRDAEEATQVAHPKRDLAFLREALDAERITEAQARECVAKLRETRSERPEARLSALMVDQGLLSEEQVDELLDRAEARENRRRDRQFARFALDAGLANSAQITHCARLAQRRSTPGQIVKLSKVLVEEGILDQQQVVRLLLRQLKDAQRREDEEFLELVRGKGLLSRAEIDRCVREQRRQEARGHHKVLRQIVVELEVLPAERVRELLHEKVRADIEELLGERGAAQAERQDALQLDEASLKLEQSEPCPACGKPVALGAKACPACGSHVELARREAARLGVETLPSAPKLAAEPGNGPAAGKAKPAAGGWVIRLPEGKSSKPLSLKAIVKLAREKRIKATTVLRGPLTRGVWRQARHTPRLCRLFGVCHFCEAKLPPKARKCPSCGANPDQPMAE